MVRFLRFSPSWTLVTAEYSSLVVDVECLPMLDGKVPIAESKSAVTSKFPVIGFLCASFENASIKKR